MSSSQLVGRAAELTVGEAALRRALDGDPEQATPVLFVAGEAGIGKSRLLEVLLDRARQADAVTACGRCLEHGGEIRPLAAMSEILADLGEEVDTSTLAPAEALARLFDRARTSLRTASARGAVVVAVEDLHWSDRTTRTLLAELVRTRGLGRMLLIGTYRSDELHRRHPLLPFLADLEHAVRPERIDLVPLDEAEVVELGSAILDRPIGAGRGRELARRSGGNPFYAEELLAVDVSTRIPAGVSHVILARSRSLEPDALACLQAASVLAPPIYPAALQITSGLATLRYRRAVDVLCRERFLIDDEVGFRFRHELVREVFLDGLLPGERAELFARAAQALEEHRPERRGEIARLYANAAQLPQALAAAVQAAAAAGSIGASAEAVEHYGRAIDLWDRVDGPAGRTGVSHLRLLRSAAQAADLARDFDVAVELATRAVDEARAAGDPFEEGGALLELSGYLWDASAPGMHEAIERAMAVLPSEPLTVERIRLEVRSAMNRAFAGDGAAADLALAAAAQRAAELDERGVEATARAHVGYGRVLLGDEQALRNLTDGLHVAQSIDDGTAGTLIAINLTHALVSLGRFRDAAELYDDGVAFNERHGYADTRGILFQGNVLDALEALGWWEAAAGVMDDIGRRLSPETMHRWASAFLGWTQIQIHRGHYAEAASTYRRGLEMWQTGYYSGDQLPAGSGLIELAAAGVIEPIDPAAVEMWLDELQPDQASLDARLVATAARHLVPPVTSAEHSRTLDMIIGWIARLRRMRAEFVQVPPVLDAWLSQADAEVAEADGDMGADRWAGQVTAWAHLECEYLAGYARFRQADALLRTGGGRSAGDRATATGLLRMAWRTASALGADPLCRDVQDLARRARLRIEEDNANSVPAPTEPSPFGLTARELEVLRLVNDGRSNGEIGTKLFINTKTASVHVSNILQRLGASNRIEAAAIARRHRLVDR